MGKDAFFKVEGRGGNPFSFLVAREKDIHFSVNINEESDYEGNLIVVIQCFRKYICIHTNIVCIHSYKIDNFMHVHS